jgi:D-alanine-D-alanine ligase
MKIAIVRNRGAEGKVLSPGVVARFGQACPEVYAEKTVEAVAAALHDHGHEVRLCEADSTLFAELLSFMPPDGHGRPTGLVFNMAYGIQGECRYTHVPGMLELAGVPYTGSGPLGHALALDKVITKQLMVGAGVPTPRWVVTTRGAADCAELRYPLVVKPKHESTSYGLALVHDAAELDRAVDGIVSTYGQEALVEEYVDGREFCVGLLGNDPVELLPIVEQDFGARARRIMTWEDKFHKVGDEPKKVCPAPVGDALARRLRDISVATFRACHLKDYARVDIRVDDRGEPFVLEINSMASLGASGSYMMSAHAAGYSFDALVNRIVDVTHCRYFGVPAPITPIVEACPARAVAV